VPGGAAHRAAEGGPEAPGAAADNPAGARFGASGIVARITRDATRNYLSSTRHFRSPGRALLAPACQLLVVISGLPVLAPIPYVAVTLTSFHLMQTTGCRSSCSMYGLRQLASFLCPELPRFQTHAPFPRSALVR